MISHNPAIPKRSATSLRGVNERHMSFSCKKVYQIKGENAVQTVKVAKQLLGTLEHKTTLASPVQKYSSPDPPTAVLLPLLLQLPLLRRRARVSLPAPAQHLSKLQLLCLQHLLETTYLRCHFNSCRSFKRRYVFFGVGRMSSQNYL